MWERPECGNKQTLQYCRTPAGKKNVYWEENFVMFGRVILKASIKRYVASRQASHIILKIQLSKKRPRR